MMHRVPMKLPQHTIRVYERYMGQKYLLQRNVAHASCMRAYRLWKHAEQKRKHTLMPKKIKNPTPNSQVLGMWIHFLIVFLYMWDCRLVLKYFSKPLTLILLSHWGCSSECRLVCLLKTTKKSHSSTHLKVTEHPNTLKASLASSTLPNGRESALLTS